MEAPSSARDLIEVGVKLSEGAKVFAAFFPENSDGIFAGREREDYDRVEVIDH